MNIYNALLSGCKWIVSDAKHWYKYSTQQAGAESEPSSKPPPVSNSHSDDQRMVGRSLVAISYRWSPLYKPVIPC